jgi:para-aminobenzoate synthetase component 2
MTRVLVVDNYDSFVHTLAGYLEELGATVTMVPNDVTTPEHAATLLEDIDAVLVSPGPGRPSDAGISAAVIRASAERTLPVLGVCLGHQVIAELWGGRVSTAPEFMHGRTSAIDHDGSGVFRGLPMGFQATRYHSLAVETSSVHSPLRITARTSNGTVMGLAHRTLAIEGVQFHPESIMTEHGHQLLGNWLGSMASADADHPKQ